MKSSRSRVSEGGLPSDKEPPQGEVLDPQDPQGGDRYKLPFGKVPKKFVNYDGFGGNYASKRGVARMEDMKKEVVASFKRSFVDEEEVMVDTNTARPTVMDMAGHKSGIREIIVRHFDQPDGGITLKTFLKMNERELRRQYPDLPFEKILGFALGDEADWIVVEGKGKPLEAILSHD